MEFGHPVGRRERYRKQIILFGIAVLFPSLILLAYTLHLSRQDRELRIRRASESQNLKAQAIGRRLAEYLDKTSHSLLQNIIADPSLLDLRSFNTAEIVFVGRLEEGRLQLPWKKSDAADMVERGRYFELIHAGQQEEFIRSRPGRTAEFYSRALEEAASEGQKNHARLLEIRALLKPAARARLWIKPDTFFHAPLIKRMNTGSPIVFWTIKNKKNCREVNFSLANTILI